MVARQVRGHVEDPLGCSDSRGEVNMATTMAS